MSSVNLQASYVLCSTQYQLTIKNRKQSTDNCTQNTNKINVSIKKKAIQLKREQRNGTVRLVNETDDDTNTMKDTPCTWTEKKILLKYPGHPKQSKDSIQSLLKTMASSRKLGGKILKCKWNHKGP